MIIKFSSVYVKIIISILLISSFVVIFIFIKEDYDNQPKDDVSATAIFDESTEYDKKEVIELYSYRDFCNEYITYSFGNRYCNSIRSNTAAEKVTHTRYYFGEIEIDSYFNNEEEYGDKEDYGSSYYDLKYITIFNDLEAESLIFHPKLLRQNSDFIYPKKFYGLETLELINKESMTVEKLEIRHSIGEKCQSLYDEVNSYLETTNSHDKEVLIEADEAFGFDFMIDDFETRQKKSEYINARNFNNFTDELGGFLHNIITVDGKLVIILQLTLIPVEKPSSDYDDINVYRFIMNNTDSFLEEWLITDCEYYEGKHAGRSKYSFWTDFESNHYVAKG